jgi:23S rRNA pseudouridine1911/1915/1917 synthase
MYPEAVEVGEDLGEIKKPGIVHRLDKETSGCLIVCKKQSIYENLKKQFQNHTIQKEYVAICVGWVKHDTGIINTPIARSKSDFRKKDVVKENDNTRGEERDALTRYKVLERFEIEINTKKVKLTLISFYPKTGRMHQLRVHAKSIGFPILGDKLYGSKVAEESVKGLVNRHLLHARSIDFEDPKTERRMKITSEMPTDFQKVLDLKIAK